MSAKKIRITCIAERCWDVDDYYLVVPEIQVFDDEGFKKGDTVKVTIEKVIP